MDGITQFWGSAIGGGVVATTMACIVALRCGKLLLVGVSLRDFPGIGGVTYPLEHPVVYRALRRAAGGWRVVWVIAVTGLIAGSINAAWEAVVPATLQAQSLGVAILRGLVTLPATMWIVGRLLVASIHRHIEVHPRQVGRAA